MENVVLVIHLFLALAIIGLVLLQRSEGGGLGIGGGGGGIGNFASAQGAANFLTRATTVCAIAFFCTSLILGIIAGNNSQSGKSLMDALNDVSAAVQEIPAVPDTDVPEEVPAVPLAE